MIPALVVEPAAEQDILLGYRWYEDRRIGLGSDFLEALDFTFSQILENPLLFTKVIPGIRRSVTRTFPYLVFYVYENDTVHILAVVHAAQNPLYVAERFDA